MNYTGDLAIVAERCGVYVADLLAQAFAGETIYIGKGVKLEAKEYVKSHPDANPIQVMSVCRVSRSTAYRAVKEANEHKG